ncbi:MAG: FAD/NAD(P)-binding protein, partial [Thermoleophilia bacterium]|nr:FAD/NAD(P)-binding protein [Thermoleophilia bacterium]
MRVAIVGSGPAGFYAAEALLSHPEIEITVDMIDRLPTPFGLVRAGV